MRIAYIVPSLKNRAPVQVVRALATVMTQHGHTCCVYYFDEERELDFPCETHRINMWKGIPFHQYDIIHTHCLRSNIYAFFHKPFKTKASFVMTAHSFIFEDFVFERGLIRGWLMAISFIISTWRHQKVITLSQNAIDYFSRWIKCDKLVCIYNCVLLQKEISLGEDDLRDIIQFGKSKIVIGVNCWLKKVKGLDLLIKAMTQLPEHYRLYIVGDGEEREKLEYMCRQYGIESRVRFAGKKYAAYRYLPFYDIFVLASYTEGFSLSLLEAALYGKKCVSSDLPDIKEKFSEDEVVYFRKGDVEGLVNAILKVEKMDGIGKRARTRAERCYHKDVFYQNHIDVYNGK